jgi:hypothetical protein
MQREGKISQAEGVVCVKTEESDILSERLKNIYDQIIG